MVVNRQLFDFLNDKFLLPLNNFADFGVVDGRVYVALHHGSSFVVLDIAFPSLGRHSAVFAEALLSEVAKCQIVSIGHEILDFAMLHFL